jgi:ABC-type transport system involved in Fe-S cluster assembly fused permease/ATPase subunit
MTSASPNETEPLIRKPPTKTTYGAHWEDVESTPSCASPTKDSFNSDSDSEDDDEAEIKKKRKQRLKETGGWLNYLKDFRIFLPYLVPRHDLKVQLCILICLLCLAGRRVLNIMVPHQLGVIADKLLDREPPYRDLCVWLGLTILNDDSGLGMVEELAVIPIKQFSERQVTNAAFKHVLGLSMDFHSETDSAEVMKALEQGGALTKLLKMVVCESLPTIVDIMIAVGILYWKFDIYTSLVMMVAFLSFLALDVYTSRWKVEPRRQFAKAERQEAKVMHQAIQGWTTISYFNMFGFERKRFGKTVDAKLAADRKWSIRDSTLQGAVGVLIPLTFFTLTGMAIYNISQGRSKPGDFVFLIQYWDYLIWPLKWLSHDYREIMSNLIDAERLLALLQTKPTVVDREGVQDIGPVEGHVAFENVQFAYSNRATTIKDLTISARPGQTIALVGATGAGKSTVMKLLLRFYDISEGRITIDHHDIRDVTLDSLRDIISVVPQDPMLFNSTILENLRYAKPTATFSEIMSACRAAEIHDRILSFPDGYKTRVGEQGVKLSGGEVQRLAVARVILKDPSILILDEATSAIDTHTESNIQRALDAFKNRRKRTTFVIAHRLSTIVRADQILVFDEGRVVERGTHAELIDVEGVYKRLWSKQTAAHGDEGG